LFGNSDSDKHPNVIVVPNILSGVSSIELKEDSNSKNISVAPNFEEPPFFSRIEKTIFGKFCCLFYKFSIFRQISTKKRAILAENVFIFHKKCPFFFEASINISWVKSQEIPQKQQFLSLRRISFYS
jgi:hypothetical protein